VTSVGVKAAQPGQVLMVTVDANGNLATAPIPVCRCPSVVRPPVVRPPVVVRPAPKPVKPLGKKK
jgi:hypothetical protein